MPLVTGASRDIRTLGDVRRIAASLIDQEQTSLAHSDEGQQVQCRRGCTACCSQPVPVGTAELIAIARAIAALGEHERRIVEQRIATQQGRLAELGVSEVELASDDPDARREAALRYFSAGVACPLLDGDTCVVRDVRPLACRDYLVTSDPDHCKDLGGGQVVRVRLGRDIAGAFRTIEGNHDGPSSTRVLAMALADVPDDHTQIPATSQASVVHRLTTAAQAAEPASR